MKFSVIGILVVLFGALMSAPHTASAELDQSSPRKVELEQEARAIAREVWGIEGLKIHPAIGTSEDIGYDVATGDPIIANTVAGYPHCYIAVHHEVAYFFTDEERRENFIHEVAHCGLITYDVGQGGASQHNPDDRSIMRGGRFRLGGLILESDWDALCASTIIPQEYLRCPNTSASAAAGAADGTPHLPNSVEDHGANPPIPWTLPIGWSLRAWEFESTDPMPLCGCTAVWQWTTRWGWRSWPNEDMVLKKGETYWFENKP